MLKLKEIKGFRVIRPLAYQFVTSFAVREYISHVMVILGWENDFKKEIVSYGEATTHSEPFYNGEFDQTVLAYLNRVCKFLINKEFTKPDELHELMAKLKFNKNNRFAIAALDIAFNDAFAQNEGKSMANYLISHYRYPEKEILQEISIGVSVSMKKTSLELTECVKKLINRGVEKIKLKIEPNKDIDYINTVVKNIQRGKTKLMVDANSSYDFNNKHHEKVLLEIAEKVFMIEQPYSFDDIWNHAKLISLLLKSNLSTKICLDESIRSLDDVKLLLDEIKVISSQSEERIVRNLAINIKISRIGGLTQAMEVAKFCHNKKILIMPGGMHEFIIGRAAIAAFSAIDKDFFPGDSEGAETYYPSGAITNINGEKCKILNTNKNKKLSVPQNMGLGIGKMNFDYLKKIATNTYIVKSDIEQNCWSPRWNKTLLKDVVQDIEKQTNEFLFS